MSAGEAAAARTLARGALAALEAARRRIDDLNVYPVPDGDTGTNMTFTVRAVVESLDAAGDAGREELARIATRAALMGARGNSGVILSQVVRGAADALAAAGPLDAAAAARALRGASDAADAAVREPVEGTILTVARELAAEAERQAPAAESAAALLLGILDHGERALARTPEQLPVLAEAGVVDAGGAGLLELVRGAAYALAGRPLPQTTAAPALPEDAIHLEPSRYRYCTAFVIEGDGLDAAAVERELEPLGDSLLVVGDAHALKVHVHTDDPGAALGAGTARGAIAAVEIANMHAQAAERERRLEGAAVAAEPRACEAVAVVAGAGNRRLFEDLGAGRVIEGGPTMNPSTAQLLEAVEGSPAPEAVLLPNDPNVLMTAEQAAAHATKPVRVVRATSIPAGLAAMVAFEPDLCADENAEAMGEALEGVGTGAVTVASRAARLSGFEIAEGAYLGLVGREAVASGPGFDEVARAVADRLLAEPRDVLTILVGDAGADLGPLREHLAAAHPEVEVEVHEGGQPHYPLLLAAE